MAEPLDGGMPGWRQPGFYQLQPAAGPDPHQETLTSPRAAAAGVAPGAATAPAAAAAAAVAAAGAVAASAALPNSWGGQVAAYDTKAFAGFQGRTGSPYKLARLALEHLGRTIQQPHEQQSGGARGRHRRRAPAQLHDAVEDARAVADLWVHVVRKQLLLDAAAATASGGDNLNAGAYSRLVELQTAALLAGLPPRSADTLD